MHTRKQLQEFFGKKKEFDPDNLNMQKILNSNKELHIRIWKQVDEALEDNTALTQENTTDRQYSMLINHITMDNKKFESRKDNTRCWIVLIGDRVGVYVIVYFNYKTEYMVHAIIPRSSKSLPNSDIILI
jgi:hypothetical protein